MTSQKDQPRQISKLIPKWGANSVTRTWFGNEKSDVDHRCPPQALTQQNFLPPMEKNLKKNHVKEHEENLQMGSKKSHQVLINLRLKCWNKLLSVVHHIIKTHKDNSSHYNLYLEIDFAHCSKHSTQGIQSPTKMHLAQVYLSRLYYKCRAKVLEEINNVTYYAATTDMWTIRTTHCCMSLTLHFIQNWTLCSRYFQTGYYLTTGYNHTGAVRIVRGIGEALESRGMRRVI